MYFDCGAKLIIFFVAHSPTLRFSTSIADNDQKNSNITEPPPIAQYSIQEISRGAMRLR